MSFLLSILLALAGPLAPPSGSSPGVRLAPSATSPVSRLLASPVSSLAAWRVARSAASPVSRSAASPVSRSAALPLSPVAWPLVPPWVVRPFDPPPAPWLAGHRGADLGGPAGASVLAAGAGTVVFAGSVAGRGVVSVAHPGGLRTTYEPVFPLVSAGDLVVAGGTIATLAAGHPGCPVPACLHWGAKRGTDYVDPLALLGVRRVRLLPLPAG